jgi:signal transduction histidine kinase
MLQCYEGSVEEITTRKRAEARQAAQLAVSRILAESPGLGVAGPQLLQALCETLQLKVGAIWLIDQGGEVLRCESIWHLPSVKVEQFEAVSRTMIFGPGSGLPGRVWADGKTVWIPDVVKDADFLRAPVAEQEGLHAAVGFPIASAGRVSGVLEFVCTEIMEPDTDLQQMMSDVGIKIGQFLERKKAEQALLTKTTQLEAITGALTAFLESRNWQDASARLLRAALDQSGSEYGFIGAVVEGPALRVFAHKGVVWDEARNREFYEQALRSYRERGYLEFRNLRNLFGHVITCGEVVLSNDPASDPRSGGLPEGHPPLHAFLGVPILRGAEVVGMIGVANRPGGYAGNEQHQIEILSQAAGVLYDGYRRQQREAALEKHLRQAEKMASLGTLLGGLAHELNNPLFAITGYSQLLIEQVKQGQYEGVAQDLSAVCDAAKRATAIVERFLGQARPATGRKERCEVNTVVKKALDLVANDFRIHEIRIEAHLQENLPRIEADPNGLSEVFLNLFTNARHAMVQAHGTGTLTVATAAQTMENGLVQVEVRVTDDGPGISPEDLGRVFDPFFTTKAVGEGTGLGLFICHQIISELGGTITCESQPGSGATFFVRLPGLR